MKREEDKVICRDYVRNMCSRGDTCKYKHPANKYIFCHDYQNGKCKRDECMFIHCSRDDEEHYNQFGELPPHLSDLPQVSVSTVCKDFIRGECQRMNCKFRHPHKFFRDGEPLIKRTRYDSETILFEMKRHPWTLEDENAMLKKTIAELKKKVDDLQATNEFLLEQNAQMRIKDKVSASLTAVTVPTVTLTNAAQIPTPQVNGTALRAVTAGVATVPVSIAAVAATPVSIATVSMAPVQIPAASVAMSHQETPPSQALLPTQPSLVSYPIVARPTTLISHSPLTH